MVNMFTVLGRPYKDCSRDRLSLKRVVCGDC